MTPPVLVAHVDSAWDTTASPKTSAAITTQVGDVLIVAAATADAGTLNTPTNTGVAETWTLRQSVTVAGFCPTWVWTAVATTAQTTTVSVTRTGPEVYGFTLSQFRGSAGVGATAVTNAVDAVNGPALGITTSGANSAVYQFVTDWAAGAGAHAYRSVNGSTGTETTYTNVSGQYTVYGSVYGDAGPAGAITVGLSAPAAQNYTIVAVEVLGTSSTLGYVKSGYTESAPGGTASAVTLPSAPTAGQLLVFAMAGDKNTGALTLPGFTQLYSLLSASVSLYVYYKVSNGTETAVTASWVTSSISGNQLWYGVYDDPAVPGGTWEIVGQASRITNEATVGTWSTGQSPPTTAAGFGVGLLAMDSGASQTGFTWTGATTRFTDTRAAGAAALFVGELPAVPAGATPEPSASWTGVDQVSGAIMVFRKTSGYTVPSTPPAVTVTRPAAGGAGHPTGAVPLVVAAAGVATGVADHRSGSDTAVVTDARAAAGAVARSSPAGATAVIAGVDATGTRTVDSPDSYVDAYLDLYADAGGGVAQSGITAAATAGGVANLTANSFPRSVAVDRTAAGVADHPGDASRVTTATQGAAGTVPWSGPSSTLAIAVARAAIGRVPWSGPSTVSAITGAVSAAGGVGAPAAGDSTPTAVTAVTGAAGRAGKDGAAARATTAAVSASAATGLAGPSTTTVLTATRLAGGEELSAHGDVAFPVTVTMTGALRRGFSSDDTPPRVTATRGTVGLTQYGYGAERPVTARVRAAGVTHGGPSTYMAQILYDSLPAVYREADTQPTATNDERLLFRYLQAVLSGLNEPEVTAERIAGGELTDPVRADGAWIPWLATAMGVAGTSVEEMRARILALSVAPALASASYLIALTRSLLTDTQSIEYIPQPPWGILVRVKSDELALVGGTTDGLRDAIMATGRVPTGFTLTITTTGQTWAEIDSVTATWADRPPTESWADVDTAGI